MAGYVPLGNTTLLRRRRRCWWLVPVSFLVYLVSSWLTPPPVEWAVACGPAAAEHLARCVSSPAAAAERVQLWGERHSGTNAMERLIRTNFRVHNGSMSPHGFKHMFSTNRSDDLARWRRELARSVKRRTPTVVMTREPYRWLLSMHERPHHQPWLRHLPLGAFLRHPWLSPPLRLRPGELPVEELCRARHSAEAERANCELERATPAFGSIIEMRTAKLRLLRRELLPAGAGARADGRRVAWVRQEELEDGGVRAACRLLAELGLCPQGEGVWPVRGTANPGGGYWSLWRWAPRRRCAEAEMGAVEARWVRARLDWELEAALGYAQRAQPEAGCAQAGARER